MASPQKFVPILALFTLNSAIAAPLTLDQYLDQVEGKSPAIIAAKQASEGAELRSSEASLMYSPNLFADFSFLDDRFRNALFPSAYEKYQNDTYTVGVRQKTPWGLNAALSYDVNKIGYINAIDQQGNSGTRRFYEGTPKIELTLSLWRNLLGTETRATEDLTRSGALAAQYSQSYQAKATHAQAQGTYMRLVSAKELIKVYSDSLEKAKNLLNFSSRQVKLNLGENADLLQSQANLELQRLNLQSAQDEQRTAAREFNRLRNIDSDVVDETLVMPDVNQIKIPERAKIRDDVRAAQESAKITAAQAQLGAERNKPNLELYGSYALNARETTFGDTFDHSLKSGQQTSLVGVRLNVPLAFGSSHDAVKGFNMERDAADTLVAQKIFDQDVEWNDLVQRFNEAKKRYEIADQLAKIQKRKVDNEHVRLQRGRTTTYQTLTFTQDYNSSEAARIQALSNVLNIVAQMKTFEATHGEEKL